MAESHKDASSGACLQKKSLTLDEDFGNDFLTSWKPVKSGKDSIDFDVEKLDQNGKKSFNFDKLDDFELGGDFDKISAFKMDISDLDFSSPVKNVEKPKEKSSEEQGKQKPGSEKFSFKFDFNELDRFSLDSDLLKTEKKTSKCTDENELACSSKDGMDQDVRTNSIATADVLEKVKSRKSSRADFTGTSGQCDNVDVSAPITSDSGHHDVSGETRISSQNQATVADERRKQARSSEGLRDLHDGTCSTKLYAEKANQSASVRCISGDASSQDTLLPKVQAGLAPVDCIKESTAKEQCDSMRSIDSSHSRNTSPENSYKSRSWTQTSTRQSPNASSGIQGLGVTTESTLHCETTKGQKKGENASGLDVLGKGLFDRKSTGENPNTSPKLLHSLLNVGSRISFMTKDVNPKAAVEFKSLTSGADNTSPPISPFTSNLVNSIHNKGKETASLSSADEKCESRLGDESIKNQKDGSLKSFDKAVENGASVKERNRKNSDTCSFQVHHANKLAQTMNETGKSNTPNQALSILAMKSANTNSTEGKRSSLQEEKQVVTSGSAMSRLTKLSINTPHSTMKKDVKLVRVSGGTLGVPQSTKSLVTSSVVREKSPLLNPSLKRKTIVESKPDPGTLMNPFKRVMELSFAKRKLSEASPKIEMKISGIRTPEARCTDVCNDKLSLPSNAPLLENMMDYEVPVLLENDGNVEKAEACAKELDDICNMLKKKHEEAKELLVRAVVNNNTLLMLNHPMFEEKFRALQKFATSLRSKEF